MAEQHPVAQSSTMPKSVIRVSYKVPFSVRLRHTLFSIAHFLRVMSTQTNHFQLKEFKPLNNVYRVDAYRDYLCLMYAKPENVDLSREHWQVAEINTYKDKSTKVRHEYLIAKLTNGSSGEVLLRIERRLQDSSAKAFGKAIMGRGSKKQRAKKESVPSTSHTDSDSSKQEGGQPSTTTTTTTTATGNEGKRKKFKKNAVDEVTLVDPNAKDQAQLLVERIVYDARNRISLPQLIVLACAINDHSKDYHFFEKNCYWFCYCAVEALRQRNFGDRQPVDGKQGSWRGLPTGHLWEEVDFDALLKRYDRMWDEFDQEIDRIVNNPNNKFVKKAERRAEEERKRAEESERRVEEERKRAEESERRAEEDRKQMERRIAELEAKLAQANA